MRKITLCCLSLLLVMGVLLAGCGVKEADRLDRIQVVGWNIQSDAFTLQSEAFEKANPGSKVEVRYVDNMYTTYMPQMAAGVEFADIVLFQNRDFPYFMEKYPDAFLDLTDFVKPFKDEFMEASWDCVTKDGKIYGLPTDMGPAALFYREDLFQKAGIDPASIQTWDDLIAANEKMKAATNGETVMLGTAEDTDLFDVLLTQNLGHYVSEDNKTVILNDEKGKAAMDQFIKLCRSGATKDIKDWDGRIVAMRRNQIACVPYGVWFAGTISNCLTEQKGLWKIMPIPKVKGSDVQYTNSGGSVVAICKGTKHPELCKQFLDFALHTEEGNMMQMQNGLFPAYKPIYDSKQFNKMDPFFNMKVYKYFADIADKIPPMHRGPITMGSAKATNDMIVAAIEGTDDAETIVNRAAKDIAEACGLSYK